MAPITASSPNRSPLPANFEPTGTPDSEGSITTRSPHRHRRDLVAPTDNRARDIHSRGCAGREPGHVVPALALHDVEAVQRARLDANKNIHPARRRIGNVDVLEHLGCRRCGRSGRPSFQATDEGLANAAGWRTLLAKIVIATMVTTLGAMAKKAESIDL